MSTKKKFESIDQSQLSESQKAILSKIKTATKDFTITDEKALEKVDGALDNIIEKLKKTNPQAIKSEKKEVVKPKKEVSKKPTESRTKEPKKGTGSKRTIFSIAKEIRKADESWEDAKKRAKKVMESEKEDTTKKMKSETDKLLAFIKRRKELDGISGTTLKKDAKLEALPKGKRISKKGWKNQHGESKGGKVYYENRDNRSDRLAPNYPSKVYLEDGGGVENKDTWQNLLEDFGFKKGKSKYGLDVYSKRGYVATVDVKQRNVDLMFDNEVIYSGYSVQSLLNSLEDEFGKRKFQCGGSLTLTPETPLARGLGMDYTGLVGETGAMSSGEMFADGGGVGKSLSKFRVGESFRYKDNGTIVYRVTKVYNDGACEARDEEGDNYTFEADELSQLEEAKYEVGGSLVDGYLTDPNFGDFQAGVYSEGGNIQEDDRVIITTKSLGKQYEGMTGVITSRKLINGLYSIKLENGMEMAFSKNEFRHNSIKPRYEAGGSTGLPEGTQQHFVNYYLGEGTAQGIFAKGGGIENQYIGKTPSEIWSMYSTSQKYHFLLDHSKEIESTPMSVEKATKTAYRFLPEKIKKSFQKHIREGQYAMGGSLENHGLKEGDQVLKTISGGVQKVRTKDGEIVFVDLANGYRDYQPPLPFAEGGRLKSALARDRKYLNKSQSWERQYSKNKPSRKGYKFDDGGFMNSVYAKKGALLSSKERYILELKGLTGLTQDGVEKYISDNGLTEDEVLNIVIGLGRKQIQRMDVATAMIGKKNNAESKRLIKFAKSDKALKMADGGTIDAFQMRTVRGTDTMPTEIRTNEQEVMFKKGGETLSDKTNGYVSIDSIDKVVTKDGKVFKNTYSDTAVISGVHFSNKPLREKEGKDKNQMELFKKGGLPKTAIYIPRYKVDYIETEDGDKIEGNHIYGGVWIDMKKQFRLIEEAKKQGRFEGGGKTTKRGGAMVLAKKIRKEGESWKDALKRANQELKK
jgi:hypothetical protein